jgi:uncharacterized SAM-binding protein YcdF (DUF218 family)
LHKARKKLVRRTSIHRNQNVSNPKTAQNFNVELQSVPSAEVAPYVFFFILLFQSYLKKTCFFYRTSIFRAPPLWAKIFIGATLCIMVVGGIAGVAAFLSLRGQYFIFIHLINFLDSVKKFSIKPLEVFYRKILYNRICPDGWIPLPSTVSYIVIFTSVSR